MTTGERTGLLSTIGAFVLIPCCLANGATRTKAEIVKLIEQAGTTNPAWWDATPLDYPKTLDLSGAKQTKGPQQNLGSYKWSVLNRQPGKWKQAVKLFHHVVTVRQNDRERLSAAMDMLASAYRDYLGDRARAAYWWRQAMSKGGKPYTSGLVNLAECYWKLGSKPAAVALLKRYGLDRRSSARSVIKLWGDLGQAQIALALAERRARSGQPDEAYLGAGNACRIAGQYDKAIGYYQKVLAAPTGSRRIKRNKDRARASIAALKLAKGLDLTRVPGGSYTSHARGFKSEVHVQVVVKDKKIESVNVTRHNESPFFVDIAKRDMAKRIVARHGIRNVDAVTGATITSEAILNATVKALAGGMK